MPLSPRQGRYPFNAFISYSHKTTPDTPAALQNGLHRLAKPVFTRRALRVFRDKTSLSANPELWPSILRALEQSEFFLLIASPDAAASRWVKQEVEWWLANRPIQNLLIVVASGEIAWDLPSGDFDWKLTNCLPHSLAGRFTAEPCWVDLRWITNDNELSLRHSQFRACVLDLAAPLHDKPKEDLDGDDVRQQRRLRNAAWAVGCALAGLTVFSVLAANEAVNKQRAAEVAQREAVRRKEDADTQRDLAKTQRGIAETQRGIAEEQTRSTQAQLARNWYRLSQAADSPARSVTA